MDGTIEYLETLREDLLDAAAREVRRGGRARLGPGLRDRFSPRRLVAAATTITLVAAGSVGWIVTRDEGAVPGTAPSGPAAGATGATGAVEAPAGVPSPGDEGFLAIPQGGNGPYDVGAEIGLPAQVPRVIRTAELGLTIPRGSFEDRFAEAVEVAEGEGGFVATSTTRERSGEVTMRVPADNFADTLASLRELGDVEIQILRGLDVTDQYVDLRVRLRIAKARRAVLLDLMDRAASIEQTIRVQNALDDTQLRIEGLQGERRLLDDRTSLAEIRLRMREEGVEPAEIETPSLPNAFERAWAGFVGVIAAVVIGIGYLIPILVIGLVAWFVLVRVRRRRRAL